MIGDGAAGIMIANKSRLKIPADRLEVTVIGKSPNHYFKPDGIHIPFGFKDYRNSVKPNRFLINRGITYLVDEVTSVDIEERKVLTRGGRTLGYDYLIIATGDRYTPEDVPGYESEAKHFYDLEHALELRKHISGFRGGKIVIGRASEPIQCPPAPLEISLLLDQYFRSMGMRDKVEMHYLYPIDGTFSIPVVSRLFSGVFEERGITNHTYFNVERIDAESHKVISYEGETQDYDLLIMLPPHRGQKFLTDSGLADEYGYVDVDRKMLNYKGHDDVFVIGDATNLPITKAGSVAHFEADYLSSRLASELSGSPLPEGYDGTILCFVEAGMEKAVTLYYTHQSPPRALFTSKLDHLLKWTSTDTYFASMVRGLV